MRKLAALAGVAALGLSAQAAFGYGGSANVTFTFGGSLLSSSGDQGFVSTAGAVTMPLTNATYFSQLAGANSLSTYNQDFADVNSCNAVLPGGATLGSVRQYGCRYATDGVTFNQFIAVPVTDGGPVGQASGTLYVSDTTLVGTLNLLSTTDEPTGVVTVWTPGSPTFQTNIATSTGLGSNGYNYRSADGSPFGNSWYGTTTAGVLTVNLTGTFNDTTWNITGGWVDYSDSGFACQQGGFGGDARGTLCTRSATGGGFASDGGNLAWGMDPDGGATNVGNNPNPGMIAIRDGSNALVEQLSGVLASLTLDGSGNITTGQGEFRRGLGNAQGGCSAYLRYDGGQLTCGSLTAGNLNITGVSSALVPVPASVWLMGSALGLLGYIRRKVSA